MVLLEFMMSPLNMNLIEPGKLCGALMCKKRTIPSQFKLCNHPQIYCIFLFNLHILFPAVIIEITRYDVIIMP